jgi:hypothetical protein
MSAGNIYYFNPTCELAVTNGSFSYQPPLLLQQMEADLAILPFVFCSENDFVLTENKPSEKFIQDLKNAGFQIPHFCTLADLEAMPNGSFDEIIPWGWSPATHYKLARLKEKCSPGFKNSPVYNWQEVHKTLYERACSLSFLNELITSVNEDYLIPEELCGTTVFSTEEIEKQLNTHKQLVLKAPLSSSGRGIQMLRKTELDRSRRQWISGILKQQGYLIAEPYLEKLLDFSFQFKIKSKEEVDFLGISYFETNSNGQYQRTFLNITPEILTTNSDQKLNDKIQIIAELIGNKLINSVYAENYKGYIGIDALIFEYNNQLFIQPCIEINCRMNMGILTKCIEKRFYSNCVGKFEVFFGNQDHMYELKNKKMANSQLSFSKFLSKYFFVPLTEIKNGTRFFAYTTGELAR